MTKKESKEAAITGWASVATLAEHFDVNAATIWRWTQQGKLPQPVKLSPGCTRWKWEEILTAGGAEA